MPTVEQNGFEGELFIGNGSKNIVMIVMSGANGGMKLTKGEAVPCSLHIRYPIP